MRSIVANLLVISGLTAIIAAAGIWNVTGGLAVGGAVAVAVGVGLIVTKRKVGP